MAKEKLTQSEIDGVQYRRARLWQIILYSCNALVGMSVYSLIGYANYSASIGYGIATVLAGTILTGTRILDAVTDPILAFIYDRVDTKFGRLRILLVSGFLIEAVALLCMFHFCSGKGFGTVVFILLYCIYIIGYTITNMTAQTIPAIMSNDPKQRPMLGVWSTAFNYLVPMILMIVLNMVLLPSCGGEYNQSFLSGACLVCIGLGAVGIILVCIGVSAFDKPEYYKAAQKQEPLKIKDMADLLAHNRPLQCYIISAASDKLAQQTAAQSVVTTMLMGIIIGNMGLSTALSVAGMLPSILFAVFGAKYAGKYGSRKAIFDWSIVCMLVGFTMFMFFVLADPKQIAHMGVSMILYVLFTLVWNGAKMCVTTANTAFMADIIDYELDRSGKYIPAVVTGVYSLIDKLVSAFSAAIAAGAVALIGYTATMPQPTDQSTPAVFWMTMGIYFGMPIAGWGYTLIAMHRCKLGKEEMVGVQKRIAEKKEAARDKVIKENLK